MATQTYVAAPSEYGTQTSTREAAARTPYSAGVQAFLWISWALAFAFWAVFSRSAAVWTCS